ncbi:hypothetical protein L873DRAFT_61124 [Choiromyces venosus 120613-1]|uniref:Uncharacterized protein n=1 Tax=Choiromyces venosus 120613-1 TaxID=1336337 RepID=A0A3N4J533_9PEZI|nr:hypothetical protein L873DRAFT_61124 [Choiromyces venosus 120613-1]
MGKKIKTDKLLSRCPYFFRLESILGDRPNVHPPILYDSSQNTHETTAAVEQLLRAITSNIHPMEEGDRLQSSMETEDGGILDVEEENRSGGEDGEGIRIGRGGIT